MGKLLWNGSSRLSNLVFKTVITYLLRVATLFMLGCALSSDTWDINTSEENTENAVIKTSFRADRAMEGPRSIEIVKGTLLHMRRVADLIEKAVEAGRSRDGNLNRIAKRWPCPYYQEVNKTENYLFIYSRLENCGYLEREYKRRYRGRELLSVGVGEFPQDIQLTGLDLVFRSELIKSRIEHIAIDRSVSLSAKLLRKDSEGGAVYEVSYHLRDPYKANFNHFRQFGILEMNLMRALVTVNSRGVVLSMEFLPEFSVSNNDKDDDVHLYFRHSGEKYTKFESTNRALRGPRHYNFDYALFFEEPLYFRALSESNCYFTEGKFLIIDRLSEDQWYHLPKDWNGELCRLDHSLLGFSESTYVVIDG